MVKYMVFGKGDDTCRGWSAITVGKQWYMHARLRMVMVEEKGVGFQPASGLDMLYITVFRPRVLDFGDSGVASWSVKMSNECTFMGDQCGLGPKHRMILS